MVSITWEKWVVMSALGVLSLALGFLPYLIIKTRKAGRNAIQSMIYKLIITIISCFGAGVLLSIAFIHMMREVEEGLAANEDLWVNLDSHFPLAQILVLSGLILIYFIEEIAHYIMKDDGHHHFHSHHDTVAKHNSMAHNISVPDCHHHDNTLIRIESRKDDHVAHSHSDNSKANGNNNYLESRTVSTAGSENSEEDCEGENYSTLLRTFLALIALSFHEIMEGMAIGIKNSNELWFMFTAIASHKLPLSFCMGVQLLNSKAKFRTYCGSIIFFGLISSIGIFIGSCINQDPDSPRSLLVNIIEGVATGSLIYVAFFEILNREIEKKSEFKGFKLIGFLQLGSLILGMFLMTYLIISNGHEHGGDHSHGHDDGHEECHHDHEHDHTHGPEESHEDHLNFNRIKSISF